MWRSTVAVLGLAAAISACGGSTQTPGTGATLSQHSTAQTATPSTATTHTSPPRRHVHRHRRDPGRLPQTAQRPSASTRRFHRQMAELWQGITTGRLTPALPAFFPEAAYAQLKAIGDPQGDWQNRLVGAFAADIAAAHALLGSQASTARLLGVMVPAGYAHWVPPGVCYNQIGYWETPNSRLVYREGGQVRSFGLASLISWRGVWYVVHLGAVLPTGTGGTVDDPSTGSGYAAPSSTC